MTVDHSLAVVARLPLIEPEVPSRDRQGAVVPQPAGSSAVVLDRSTGKVVLNSHPESQSFSIGSTIKPFVLLAAYRAGLLDATTRISCQSRPGAPHACTHQRLGSVSAADALAQSCNWFTVTAGRRIPPAVFRHALAEFGLRPPEGAALGEDDLLGATTFATPSELATAYYRWLRSSPPAFLLEGLKKAVSEGTARSAAVRGLDVAGKTGTSGGHAWFAGYTRQQVIAVLVYRGRGASQAAPEAARILGSLVQPRLRVRYRGKDLELTEDEYVAMALAGESGLNREPAYVQALALLFRTFASGQRGRHSEEGFDYCAYTHCLALKPAAASLKEPLKATRRRLLLANGETAEVYFTANCGGRTEAARTVWPKSRAAFLTAREDEYCTPELWTWRAARADLERLFPRSAPLRRFEVCSRTGAGRAAELLWNQARIIPASDFRFQVGRNLGWSHLKSTWFEIRQEGEEFVFSGKGFGHGVGLCQTGAAEMARRGTTYRDIVAYYYPGCTIQLDWNGLARDLMPGFPVPPIVEHPSTESFIRATGKPGWAAAATRRGRIHLQPAEILERRGILETTLRHELVHAGVSRSVPLWFEEGAAIHLAGEGNQYPIPVQLPEAELERRLRAPASEDQLRSAYAASYWRIRRAVAEKGEKSLLESLGIPLTGTPPIPAR